MVGLFLQSFRESDEDEDTGESIEVTLDPGDWMKVSLIAPFLTYLLVQVSVWIALGF